MEIIFNILDAMIHEQFDVWFKLFLFSFSVVGLTYLLPLAISNYLRKQKEAQERYEANQQ